MPETILVCVRRFLRSITDRMAMVANRVMTTNRKVFKGIDTAAFDWLLAEDSWAGS